MIWLQPRALKSITVAVAYPCWRLGLDPRIKIMVATYGEKLTRDHADNRRSVMESDWYRAMFPGTVISPRGNRTLQMVTTRFGQCLGITVGGAVTGRGADLIVIDDSAKGDEPYSEAMRENLRVWFTTTLASRLNDKTSGAIISIQQRLHEDDLPAFLLDRGYACLNLPAVCPRDQMVEIGDGKFHHWRVGEPLDPDRFPLSVLEAERLVLGPQVYSAQYLQNPVAPEGNLLRMEQFRYYSEPIPLHFFEKIIQSWDTASSELPSADYSVCQTWGYYGGYLFLIDVYRERIEFPKLLAAVKMLQAKFRANKVLIEKSSNGIAVLQALRGNGSFVPMGCRVSEDKSQRLIGQSGQIEEGRVWLPSYAPFVEAFTNELRAFPHGRYDDQVDAMTQVLQWAMNNWRTLARQYTETGRVVAIVRGPRRPLPPLPGWVIEA